MSFWFAGEVSVALRAMDALFISHLCGQLCGSLLCFSIACLGICFNPSVGWPALGEPLHVRSSLIIVYWGCVGVMNTWFLLAVYWDSTFLP